MTITQSHQGHEIVIEDNEVNTDGQPIISLGAGYNGPLLNLKIDNRRIDAQELAPNTFFTLFLPCYTHDTLLDLAYAVIEHTAEFGPLANQ
ncbi:MAG: hypothetical protein MJK04_17005 [Psychrosphaera sp.]|nr:hypothetical protein [Psychrosphaera sp.]